MKSAYMGQKRNQLLKKYLEARKNQLKSCYGYYAKTQSDNNLKI